MAITYAQATGALTLPNGLVGMGYSGFGPGKNNSALECTPDVGPIPRGSWSIVGPPFNDPEHGPYCLRLEPKAGNSACGRSGFLIHGDSIEHPGCASKGCIIQSRVVREAVVATGDRDLEVI